MRCRLTREVGQRKSILADSLLLREGHRCRIETAGCGVLLRPLMAGSSRCLMDPTPPGCYSAVGFDVQCSRLLKTTCRTSPKLRDRLPLSFSERRTSSPGWLPK